MAQVTGDEQATQRVEAARETLSDYYRALRESLDTQRQEVDETRQQFEQQKIDFRSEQQTLTDWIAQREQQLRRQEEQLQSQLTQIADQEQSWQRARDTWLTERLEAERIIRQLLSELSTSIDTASGTRATELPEMPSLLGLARFLDNAA
jgi:chromosome segregation ATPase